jgi:hypothetical protein
MFKSIEFALAKCASDETLTTLFEEERVTKHSLLFRYQNNKIIGQKKTTVASDESSSTVEIPFGKLLP